MTADNKQSGSKEASLLKRALLKIEQLQAEVDATKATMREPVAIVGMGCRLPGGVSTPNEYWQALIDGIDMVVETPADRWNADDYYDPTPGVPGKVYSKAGAFLDDIDQFDPQFFGIAPREASSLDPQQRLLLECSWEALENAGLSPDALAGSSTGVFFGIGGNDYAQLQLHQQDSRLLDTYHASGVAHSVAAGRVSYALGLIGPSVAIDTACSSSLVAIHYACQSLRSGESRTALAGGVNVMLAPFSNIAFCQSSMISPNGRCATFDAAADGFVQGEGCGVIVLKLLRDAIADGDRVEAVIRGTAINQDGASSGLTAPNGPSQEAVIRAALANGGVNAGDVSFVETHGSGTPLGDPIEVQALARVLGEHRTAENPLLIGSVKTNLGHLATAAGVAGLIKVVLAMREKQIPKQLHFKEPSPHIPWAQMPVRVTAEHTPWDVSGATRIAGVSGFGFSGTNVHIVVEEPPEAEPPSDAAVVDGLPLALSAKTSSALKTLAQRYADDLSTRPETDLSNVLFTANAGRSHFKHRLVASADTTAGLARELEAFADGRVTDSVRDAVLRTSDQPRIAFLFAGQGGMYPNAGRGLFDTEPVYREAIELCSELLQARLEQPLVSVLYGNAEAQERAALLKRPDYAMPAQFAVEYALACLWRSYGVEPWMVAGHGAGEYVAVCIAGAVSLQDALALAAERGRLMTSLPADGAMAAVYADLETVTEALASVSSTVSLAAVYGPAHLIVSGQSNDVQKLLETFSANDIRTTLLDVHYAAQSPLLDPVLDDLEQAAGNIDIGSSSIGVVSSVSGKSVPARELRSPAYWRSQAREPLDFQQSINTLCQRDIEIFLEIGPGTALSGLGASVAAAPDVIWMQSLARDGDDRQQFLGSLGRLYLNGVDVDWRSVFNSISHQSIVLPGYPFERDRYWIEGMRIHDVTASHDTGFHPLLGSLIETPLDTKIYETKFGAERTPDLYDHVVHGIVVVPAAAILEMVIAAARSHFGRDALELLDLSIPEALVLEEGFSTRVQLVVTPESGSCAAFTLYSQQGEQAAADWRAHASGTMVVPGEVDESPAAALDSAADISDRCSKTVDVDGLYDSMWQRGLQFGERFRGLGKLLRGDGESYGEVRSAPAAGQALYRFDPAVLDACIQVVTAALPGFDPADVDSDIFMPIGIDRVRVAARNTAPAYSHAKIIEGDPQTSETLTAVLSVCDSNGHELIAFDGLHLKRADLSALLRARAGDVGKLLYRIDWQLLDGPSHAHAGPAALTNPASIAARMIDVAASLREKHGVAIYENLSSDIDALCGAYVADAFHELGLPFDTDSSFRVDECMRQLGIGRQHYRLIERFLEILCEEGVLARRGDEWTTRALPDVGHSRALAEELLQKYKNCDAELRWTKNCGDRLAEALHGDVEPHELLFPQGDLSLATTVYSGTPIARMFNGLASQAAVRAVAALPGDRPISVLEIGAGSGATTAAMLEVLPADRTRYVYSDIGPAFVSNARRRFADYAHVDFKVLDIESELDEQGIDEGQFDIIVASNVLHATADLRQTLERVESLLVPGGVLILLEVTAQQRWFDLTVGLTDGWWRFEDTDLRPRHPLLDASGWSDLLRDVGFTDPVAVPGETDPAFDQAVILAQKPLVSVADKEASAPDVSEDWFLFADETGVATKLAGELLSAGVNCVTVAKGDEYGVEAPGKVTLNPQVREHFDRFAAEFLEGRQNPQRLVYLWALDYDDPDSANVDDLWAAQEELCGGALHLVQALGALAADELRLAIVSRGAQSLSAKSGKLVPTQSTLWGLHKAIVLEHPELRSLVIDLDPSVGASTEQAKALIDEVRYREDENELAFRLGASYATRLARAPERPRPAALQGDTSQGWGLSKPATGLLEDLALAPQKRRAPAAGEVEIRVLASGLNFRDVLVALDVHHDFDSIGSECAGRIERVGPDVTGLAPGDDVMAIAPRAFATHTIADANLVVRKPDGLSFGDAVTLPIAYLTADYALSNVGNMSAGNTVLIHAAAGGVGMAALKLAQRAGATVLASAGSPRKRRYLRELGVEHVMDSRSLEFAAQTMDITAGRGVDIVVNGLTGDSIEKSLSVLAPGGRFLELGKSDIWNEKRVRAVNEHAHYHAVDLTGDIVDDSQSLRPMLGTLVERVERGELLPLPWQEFAIDDAAEAFRFMEQAQHIGRIVLTQDDPDAPARAEFRDDGCYLIVGGLSGVGERVAEWAVVQGAKHLVLSGRREPSAETLDKIREFEDAGVQVAVVRSDVSKEQDVRDLLAVIAADMPPLRGLFHSAGVLDDGLLVQQDWSRFEAVMAPKMAGAWLLHTLTQDHELDFFVLFSSVASVLGGSGAGNHSAANAFLDSLAHQREQSGQPGLSINWGAWSEIGAAVRGGAGQHVATKGLGFITPEEGLTTLKRAMQDGLDQVCVMSIDWPLFFERNADQRHRRLLERLATDAGQRRIVAAQAHQAAAPDQQGFVERLEETYPNKRLALVEEHVAECAARVLELDPTSLDAQQPLSEMGLDSLMAVELRNTLRGSISQQLPATLLFDYPTVGALSRYLLNEVLSFDDEQEQTEEVPGELDLLASIENLSDEEVDQAFGE